jgi:hypothetical protein
MRSGDTKKVHKHLHYQSFTFSESNNNQLRTEICTEKRKTDYRTVFFVLYFFNVKIILRSIFLHKNIIVSPAVLTLIPRYIPPGYEYILLTPQSRVLLEKLTGSQLVKKFHTFYGTRTIINAFTSARHLTIS